MKLLLVSPLPPPIGGIASWTVNFLNYYSKNKNNWEIIHQNTAIKFRNITNINLLFRFYSGIRDTKNILTEFKSNLITFRPDVVHLTSSASLALIKDLLLTRVAKKRKISVIIHFHFGRIPELAMNKNWEWRLLCRVIKQSNTTIVIDEKSFTTLRGSGFNNVVNIPNPISCELEEIAKTNRSIHPKQINGKVIFVGHVISGKGIFELVKACVALTGVKELLIIGPFEDRIKDEIITLAKGRDQGNWLIFKGSLEKAEVLDHLRSASLLALPSYTEGFPNVVIEAMAMGCPVVATNVGAIPDMLDCLSEKPCGICVAPKNVDELKIAMNTLLRDSEKAKVMGENGKNRVLKHYIFSTISKHYEITWDKALSNLKNKTD